MANTNEKKVYNDVGFWASKNGNGFRTTITPDVLTRLKRIVEAGNKSEGGTLFFSEIKDEWKRENGPTHKLDFLPPREDKKEADGI